MVFVIIAGDGFRSGATSTTLIQLHFTYYRNNTSATVIYSIKYLFSPAAVITRISVVSVCAITQMKIELFDSLSILYLPFTNVISLYISINLSFLTSHEFYKMFFCSRN